MARKNERNQILIHLGYAFFFWVKNDRICYNKKMRVSQNIIIQYIVWQFFDVPREILRAWRNFLKFNLNYFSTILLFKTLFYPWRRYSWSRGRGFNVSEYLEVFFSNLISRIIGAIMRSFLIIIGIFTEILIIFVGLFIFLSWFILPVILIWLFFHAIGKLF